MSSVRVSSLMFLLTILIGMSILFGCIFYPPTKLSDAVPKDLYVIYSYGACHADWGRTDIKIDNNGNGLYQSGSGSLLEDGRFANEKFRKKFQLNESELLSLLVDIETSGFYSLSDSYANTQIQDGSCSYLSVTKNNVTKSVSISNTKSPEAYSKAADSISVVAEAKTKQG